jgi:hypothetical protein
MDTILAALCRKTPCLGERMLCVLFDAKLRVIHYMEITSGLRLCNESTWATIN